MLPCPIIQHFAVQRRRHVNDLLGNLHRSFLERGGDVSAFGILRLGLLCVPTVAQAHADHLHRLRLVLQERCQTLLRGNGSVAQRPEQSRRQARDQDLPPGADAFRARCPGNPHRNGAQAGLEGDGPRRRPLGQAA